MMHASFNDVGLTDREARLAYTSGVIKRDIASSSELTRTEASLVIDALVAMIEPPDEPPLDPEPEL